MSNFIDLARVGQLAVVIGVVVQYVKNWIPDYLIKPLALLFGILLAYATCMYLQEAVRWWKIGVDGILAAMAADVGYNFLSANNSPPFSLPSKR
jgi:hypothetical protein